jgi:hypothetical protein
MCKTRRGLGVTELRLAITCKLAGAGSVKPAL